ncbi:hypothetical protein B5E77_09315 [Lachnoclostridium sp. An131]|nr:hypothetical protein B5E77_09315 [Lachnoclostridium sp. An131]
MEDTVMKLKGIKKAMARQMTKSWTDVPQFHMETEVDCEPMIDFRRRLEYKPSYTAIIAKAVADSLCKHSSLNAYWGDDQITYCGKVNIGVAVDTKRGLLVPVIKNVDKLSLREVCEKLEQIKEKAVMGIYSAEELAGATFTVSSLGKFRIYSFSSIVNAPQAGILSVPRMQEKLVWNKEEENVQVRRIMRLTLALDHRIADGASGARFLTDLAEMLEKPEALK